MVTSLLLPTHSSVMVTWNEDLLLFYLLQKSFPKYDSNKSFSRGIELLIVRTLMLRLPSFIPDSKSLNMTILTINLAHDINDLTPVCRHYKSEKKKRKKRKGKKEGRKKSS